MENISQIISRSIGGYSIASILSALLTFLICLIVVRLVMKLFARLLSRASRLNERLQKIILTSVKTLLYLLTIIITAEALGEIYRELNASYYGPDIVVDDQIAVEWARIPHFYYQYYVYQYATGFSAAIALSNRILKEGASAVADYLGFLSGGSSKTPIELLKGAGVDMTTPEPTAQALAYFDELVDEFADAVR